MKEKNKEIISISIIFLIIILAPLTASYDLDGDGIDDGGQNMCGDNFCQPNEDKTSCPADCTTPLALPKTPQKNSETENKDNLGGKPADKASSLINLFKIILILVTVLIAGAVVYFIIKKSKNKELKNQIPEQKEVFNSQ